MFSWNASRLRPCCRWLEEYVLFLEFEYVFGIAVALVILLIVLFYVVYPYDKDLK